MEMRKRNESGMTIEELSGYPKIAEPALRKLARENNLPGKKVGRHWRFHKDAVDAWVKHGLEPRQTGAGS